MATSRPSKRQKPTSDETPYELIYWPTIPGRGEYIRLAFEATSTSYTDVSNTAPDGIQSVLTQISPNSTNLGSASNPPTLAPPILKHGDLTLSQTPNILLYLGPRLGLVPDPSVDPNGQYHINALTLTALDGLSNEAHDTHHPISISQNYEAQEVEALRKAQHYRTERIPKFLAYFERVLAGPASQGGEWLYGGKMTYADLVVFQALDGVGYAFPNCVKKLKGGGEYSRVFGLYERVKEVEGVRTYLGSERRMSYGMGIWRYYPELDEKEK